MSKTSLIVLILTLLLLSCDTAEVKRDRFFIQGNDALAKKEWKQAIHYFDNAIRLDDTFANAYNNRGVAKFNDDRPAEAIQDYNEALAIQADYYEALGNRAYAYDQVNRYKSSLSDWQVLANLFPDSAFLHTSKGLIQAKLNDYEGAILSFQQSLEIAPNDDKTLVDLAIAHLYHGNSRKARTLLNEAKSINPGNGHAYNALNQMMIAEGKIEQALVQVDSAIMLEPANPYFMNNKGFTLMLLDSLEEGLSLVNQSILLDGKNMWAYRNKGIYYLRTGSPKQARRYFKQVVDSEAFVEDIHGYLGLAFWEEGLVEEACNAWVKGVSLRESKSIALEESRCR